MAAALTDQQVADTIAAMRMPEDAKAILSAQVRSGDASARFVVFGAFRRQQAAA